MKLIVGLRPLLFVSHSYQANGLQFIKLPSGWFERPSPLE
jgi:hypothetical protein